MKIRSASLIFAGLTGLALVGFAKHQGSGTFDFKDPKQVNGLSFHCDGILEPINGQSSGISGSIAFDAANPEKSTGKIVVDTKSVTLAGDGISQAMQGDWCLAPAKYPTIEFNVTKISDLKKDGPSSYTAKVTGDFTLHGVTKPVTANATVTYLPDMVRKRGGLENKDGDLLRVNANFSFNRYDFGLAKNLPDNLIANKTEVNLSIIGYNVKN